MVSIMSQKKRELFFVWLVVMIAVPFSNMLNASTKTFRVIMTVNFESNIKKIAGSDAQFYFEPTGTALLDLKVVFNASGGEALSNEGTVKIIRFEGKGPHCRLSVPDGLIGNTVRASFKSITWNPDGFMIFSGGMNYENPSFRFIVSCPPITAPVEDYPYFKVLGVFKEKVESLAIRVDEKSFLMKKIIWGMNDFMQSEIEGVIEMTENP